MTTSQTSTVTQYYEVEFDTNYFMAIKGLRKPSLDEATVFLKDDLKIYEAKKVIAVDEISRDDAARFYDVVNEQNWPIFK